MNKQTEAMKLALEQLEYYAANKPRAGVYGATIALREALASEAIEQPAQQEPVAVVKALPLGHGQTEMHYAECQHLPVGTLLYTSPQAQREWVGLSESDRRLINFQWQDGNGTATEIIDLVESKLKEKNT